MSISSIPQRDRKEATLHQLQTRHEKIEAQLKTEVQERLALGEVADQSALPDEMSLPDEIQRREFGISRKTLLPSSIPVAQTALAENSAPKHERG